MREDLQKKVDRAIKLIVSAYNKAKQNGSELEVCYSGGKDSDVILELAKMSKVPYRAIYKSTSIDPAGTIKHARDMGAEIMRPKENFFALVEKNGFPNMFRRHCCRFLKEYKILDYAVLGIRKEESRKRNERYNEPEMCRVYSTGGRTRQYFPILDWTSRDVADFVEERGIKCHSLYYDEKGAFHPERRLGCMCCPMTDKKRIAEFLEHPNMVKAYIRAGKKFLEEHPDSKPAKEYADVYAWFVRDLFYWRKSNEEWNAMNESPILPPPVYKDFLQNYFKIKFEG